MTFDIIEAKRIEKRYTVTELCNEVGIDRSSFYNYKRNPDTMPILTLNKFARALSFTQEDMTATIQ